MTADSYSLLELILELLKDGDEAEKFAEDPNGYLESKGLDGICADDVRDLKALVLDYDTNVKAAFGDTTFDLGNKGSAHGGDAGGHGGGGPHYGPPRHDDDHDGGHDGGEHNERDAVIKEITNILNNYTYTTIDDRDLAFDQSVKQNIFAKGDVEQSFDYDTTVASGDGAVAAGGDVYGAATGDGAIAAGGDIEGDAVSGDGNVTGNGNALVSGDGNVVGDENEVGNTEVDIEDSFNDQSDDDGVDDSFNNNDLSDDDGVDDSFNGNDLSETDNSDNSVNDSFDDNEIGNTETETEIKVEDVAVAVDDAIAAVDNELEVSV
jgi:hypothetical protein